MELVVQTFYLAALPITLFCALLQLGLWLRDRERTVYLWWAASDFVGMIGACLVVAREYVPWWVSTALGNSIIVAAGFLVWAGMCRFGGLRIPGRAFVACTVLFFVLFHGMWFITQDLGLRVLLTSVALGLINAGVAIDLTRSQQRQKLRTRSFLTALFALHALFYLFRSATAVTLEADDEFLRSGGIQNFALIIGTLKMLLWNLVTPLMVREARQAARAAAT